MSSTTLPPQTNSSLTEKKESQWAAVPDRHDFRQCLCHLQGSLLQLSSPPRSAAAEADVLGDAHVDRDERRHAVDCMEVLDGAQSSVA